MIAFNDEEILENVTLSTYYLSKIDVSDIMEKNLSFRLIKLINYPNKKIKTPAIMIINNILSDKEEYIKVK